MNKISTLKKKATDIRIEIIRMICRAKGGHIGGSLSGVDILVALYYDVLNIDPKRPDWGDRDRFILSKGHGVEGYYAILADRGFFPKEELETYRKFRSRLLGHPTMAAPGIEMNTGALGHGLSLGVGMALAGKMDNARYSVYVMFGDGESDEGSVWEAAMAGAQFKLDNLIGIVDRNTLQMSGETEKIMKLESFKDKWSAFGWSVKEVDGHNIEQLIENFKSAPLVSGKPSLFIANTIKGTGVSFMQNKAHWHHKVPDAEQMHMALEELQCRLEEVEAE